MNTVQRNKLVEHHLDLAKNVARRAILKFPPSIEFDDVLQEAYIGLLRAADRFTVVQKPGYKQPVPFRCFAGLIIWGAIMDANRRRHYWNATHFSLDSLSSSPDGRDPDAGEGDPAYHSLASVAPDYDERIDAQRRARAVENALEYLPRRERTVVLLYYRGEKNNREIGEEDFALSQERIGQIHRGALMMMRRWMPARMEHAA